MPRKESKRTVGNALEVSGDVGRLKNTTKFSSMSENGEKNLETAWWARSEGML